MWATARRHPKMMQFLISKGADVNARGDGPRLPTSRAGRGTSEESGFGWLHAIAVRRARELHGVREVVARRRRGHQPAGSGWRFATAAVDHECELGYLEASDPGRRRRQSVGRLWRGAALHGAWQSQSGRRRKRRGLRPTKRDDGNRDRSHAARARSQSRHAAFLPPGESERRRPTREAPRR